MPKFSEAFEASVVKRLKERYVPALRALEKNYGPNHVDQFQILMEMVQAIEGLCFGDPIIAIIKDRNADVATRCKEVLALIDRL